MSEWVVSSGESGLSLSAFIKLKAEDAFTGKQIKNTIDAGGCQVNGRVERFSSVLVGRGDRITFQPPEKEKIVAPPIEYDQKRILLHDDHIFAYNKPAGVSSDDSTLLETIRQHFPNAILLHRLDRDTTGVLLFACNEMVAKNMLAQFKKRQIIKHYLAIVDGIPTKSTGVIENFLGKLHVYHGQTLWGAVRPDQGGLRARTTWLVRKTGHEATLLDCSPETGRTHQIRVHLAGIGHPILGDLQYGRSFACSFRPKRLMLHARQVEFQHPVTGKKQTIAAELPQDFKDAIEKLMGELLDG